MPGKFVVKKGTTGKFRFNLLSTNGQVVATSEAYNSKASAMGGIRSVKKLAADAAIEDQTTKEWAADRGGAQGCRTGEERGEEGDQEDVQSGQEELTGPYRSEGSLDSWNYRTETQAAAGWGIAPISDLGS